MTAKHSIKASTANPQRRRNLRLPSEGAGFDGLSRPEIPPHDPG